ncbi:686_t:CDS:2 [Ambispora leptoticha]|uniref:686_t:CDS:1 n=1 Tax=Ambispora leptoticha TaxID=144679 RepID=A0A9N9BGD2_9GLOM|nr:686_t:CDS:2 [Ambispora leptoticha]
MSRSSKVLKYSMGVLSLHCNLRIRRDSLTRRDCRIEYNCDCDPFSEGGHIRLTKWTFVNEFAYLVILIWIVFRNDILLESSIHILYLSEISSDVKTVEPFWQSTGLSRHGKGSVDQFILNLLVDGFDKATLSPKAYKERIKAWTITEHSSNTDMLIFLVAEVADSKMDYNSKGD